MNFKHIIKEISKFLLTAILLFLRIISLIATPQIRTKIGKIFGSIGYKIMSKRRNIAIENLSFAFPDKSNIDIEYIAKCSFQNLGITFLELFAMTSLNDDELRNMIYYGKGIELINDTYSRKKGVMFLSGHFGNWELSAYSVRVFTNLPITVIVKPQANSFADKYLNKYRTARGNRIVSMYFAARTIINVIKNGEVIALLADQAATADKDIFVDFFGRSASTYKVVAEIALRHQIPIIMGFAVRQPDGKYIELLSELDHSDLDFTAENVRILTQRHVKALEDIIRKYPEQWTWMHKRWKHNLQAK